MAVAKPLQVLPLQPQFWSIGDRYDVVDHIAVLQIPSPGTFLAKAFDIAPVIVAKINPFRVISPLMARAPRGFVGSNTISTETRRGFSPK